MERATNSLQSELETMAVVGRALGDLTDPAARQRVLRWAAERFAADLAQTPSTSQVIAPASSASDPALAVDSLSDIFSVVHDRIESEEADDTLSFEQPAFEKQPLETMIRSFAADFQRFAEEWNGAAA